MIETNEMSARLEASLHCDLIADAFEISIRHDGLPGDGMICTRTTRNNFTEVFGRQTMLMNTAVQRLSAYNVLSYKRASFSILAKYGRFLAEENDCEKPGWSEDFRVVDTMHEEIYSSRSMASAQH